MRPGLIVPAFIALVSVVITTNARAETPDEWITLGARVHGGFGSFIPVGIRIGLDSLQRLKAKPREVTIVYYDSDKAPCACVADGIAIATVASAGQRTLQIAAEKAPAGRMAVASVLRALRRQPRLSPRSRMTTGRYGPARSTPVCAAGSCGLCAGATSTLQVA